MQRTKSRLLFISCWPPGVAGVAPVVYEHRKPALSPPRSESPLDSGPVGLTERLVGLRSDDGRVRRHQQERAAAVAIAVVLGFGPSLVSLISGIAGQTPQAYLGLVPILALLVAVGRLQPRDGEPDIHDRQVDYILGVPLLGAALAVLVLMPDRVPGRYVDWRLDLLALPLFVAGACAIVLGSRALWRLRLPIAMLILAWPVPVTLLLESGPTGLVSAPARAVLALARGFGLPHGPTGPTTWVVGVDKGAGSPVEVSLAWGWPVWDVLFGAVVVAAALWVGTRGRRRARLLWLGLGLGFALVLGIGRVVLAIALLRPADSGAAGAVLHWSCGLAVLGLVAVTMVAVRPAFGLRAQRRSDPDPRGASRRPAVATAGVALTLVVVAAAMASTSDPGLIDKLESQLGNLPVALSVGGPRPPAGWRTVSRADVGFARRYFGGDSRFMTARFMPDDRPALFVSELPIDVEVTRGQEVERFAEHPAEEGWQLGDAVLRESRNVQLGRGIVGEVLSFDGTQGTADRTTLVWHWRVSSPSGEQVERVVLRMGEATGIQLEAPRLGPGVIGPQVPQRRPVPRPVIETVDLARARNYLVAFARSMVAGAPR